VNVPKTSANQANHDRNYPIVHRCSSLAAIA
jgi:hypothetical protein